MIPDYLKNNFQTLLDAAKNDDVALVQTTRSDTGETVYVVCAVNAREDGIVDVVPFAEMYMGDPFDVLNPPDGTYRVNDDPEKYQAEGDPENHQTDTQQ